MKVARGPWVAGLLAGLALVSARANLLTLDPGFTPRCTIVQGTMLTAVALQPDGKLIVAGRFELFHGRVLRGLARLHPNGAVDSSFNPGAGAIGGIGTILVQPDGQLLVAGGFTTLGGAVRHGVARLLANGPVDLSFTPYLTGPNFNAAYCAALQPDGRILVGGNFARAGFTQRRGIARLNPDGTVDETFNPGDGIADEFAAVYDLAVQTDGKIIIVGDFKSFDGIERTGLARLNSDGSLDASFLPSSGPEGQFPYVADIKLQSDGRLLIAGGFSAFSGVERPGLARLNLDGTVDKSFDPGLGVEGNSAQITELIPLPDGKVILVGDFASVDGIGRNGVARLDVGGKLDAAFEPGSALELASGMAAWANGAALQPDGRLIAVGAFDTINGEPRHHLGRLMPDGSLDLDFGRRDALFELSNVVYALYLQNDGRLVVGGDFERVNGFPRNGLARLNPDGTLDLRFNPALGAGSLVYALAADSAGRLVVGGSFVSVGDQTRLNVARLHPDGSLDKSFDSSQGPDGPVRCLAAQSDFKIVIGGLFQTFGNVPRRSLARLNADGSLDTEFTPTIVATFDIEEVYAVALTDDGRVLVGGYFDRVNGQPRSNLSRLNPDGTLDPTFYPGLEFRGALPLVLVIATLQNDNLVIGGAFDAVSGLPGRGIALLNPTGVLDGAFKPGTGIEGDEYAEVDSVCAQADGKILIGGEFSGFNGVPLANLAQLNPDGSLDAGFNPGSGANAIVTAIVSHTDGSVIVGGAFTAMNGQPRFGLARFSSHGLPGLRQIHVRSEGGLITLWWEGEARLEWAESVAGPWNTFPDAASPYVVEPSGGAMFFRLGQ